MIASLQNPHATVSDPGGELALGSPDPRLAMKMERDAHRSERPPAETLWRRMGFSELDVQLALMLQEGCSNAEIARRLGISEEAAGHRTARILAELCVRRTKQYE